MAVFPREEVVVALSTDQEYVAGAIATIQSILAASSSNYVFYVIDCGVDNASINRIRSLATEKCKINILDTTIPESLPEFWTSSNAVYARLLLPEILSDHDRAIYIDVDILVSKDLAELWRASFGEAHVMACQDQSFPTIGDTGVDVKSLSLPADTVHYNSGLLLMDLQALRVTGGFRRALEILVERPEQCIWHDQSAINYALFDKISGLDVSWNMMINCHSIDALVRAFGAGAGNLHYVTHPKPWGKKQKLTLADLIYLRALRSSPGKYRKNSALHLMMGCTFFRIVALQFVCFEYFIRCLIYLVVTSLKTCAITLLSRLFRRSIFNSLPGNSLKYSTRLLKESIWSITHVKAVDQAFVVAGVGLEESRKL